MQSQLETLERLTGMVLDTELARLKQISHRQAVLMKELDDLLDSRAHQLRIPSGVDQGDQLHRHQQVSKWLDWQAGRKAALLTTAAGLAGEKEDQISQARLALGRVQVVRALIGKSKDDAAILRAQRQARE